MDDNPKPHRSRKGAPQPSECIIVRLSDQHAAWVGAQSRALRRDREMLLADVLEEWLNRNEDLRLPGASASQLVKIALDDFIARHGAEFITPDSPNDFL